MGHLDPSGGSALGVGEKTTVTQRWSEIPIFIVLQE